MRITVDEGPRYAVFFVPPAQSDLYRFGSAVIGYDCYAAEPVDQPIEFKSNPEDWRRLTAEPRRYGFHATLKAPFHLSPSCTEAQLVSAIQSFVGLGHAVPRIAPTVQILNGFAAIVPLNSDAALATLADSCTTIFDAFRAPMSARERAQRVALGLNQSQISNLDRWGYSYVLSDFQFHMTLTGKIQGRRRDKTLAVIQKCFHRLVGNREFAVDRIALLKQDGPSAFFRVVSHASLRLD